jgi:hypothetical protein
MITPGDYTLKAGERIALSCIGIFPYNVRRPLTTGIEWKIAPEGRARIDERGFFEALQPGPVQVTATYKGVSQDVQYTIEEATLSQILIFPENVSVTLEPIANGYMPKVIDSKPTACRLTDYSRATLKIAPGTARMSAYPSARSRGPSRLEWKESFE